MGHIDERSDAGYPIAETLWIIAGVILLLALGDFVIVLALALAAVAMTTAWRVSRNSGSGVRSGGDVTLASVSHLPMHGPKRATAHAPWHRHGAA